MRVLLDQLEPEGALAGDDQRVVEGGDVGVAMFRREAEGLLLRLVEGVAEEDHGGAVAADRVDLDGGGRDGHDDHGLDAEQRGRERDTLGMVAGGRCDDSTGGLVPVSARIRV